MKSKQVVRYDLRKYKGVSCKSFAIRETNGFDEERAAQAAKMKGGSANTGEELLRFAIVEVDGKPVKQPFLELETWNTKTRGLALRAWTAMNTISTTEEEDFLRGGELVDAGALLPPSQPSADSDDNTDEDGLE